MKRKLRLLTSIVALMITPLSGCEYKYSYSVPAYPPTNASAQDDSGSGSPKLPTILPTGLTLSLESKVLTIGESFQLYSDLTPYNVTDKSLSWTTTDMNIASVSGSGEVTGNGIGTAVITVKSNAKKELFASCSVTVEPVRYEVTDVVLSSSYETIKIGGVANLFATVLPENATNKNVNWISSNTDVVTVNNGEIRGVAQGAAVVSVATEDKGKIASCTVYVKSNVSGEDVLPTKVNVSPATKTTTVGDTFQLISTVLPENADNRTVTWSSSNTSIATVSPSGLVSTHAQGSAIIKATSNADNSISGQCEVTVNEQVISVTAVALSEHSKTLEIGESFSLTATVLPANAADKSISWSSSNTGIATVDNGVVKAISSGNAVITVTTNDGNKKAECAVVVKADPSVATPGFEDTGVDDAGEHNIKIWCDERIASQVEAQVANFQTHFGSKYNIHLTIDPVSEGNAATSMTEDVGSGADIFVFAQDQLAKLKTAGALTQVTGAIKNAIVSETESEGIQAASINGKMFAYPFTSDNGYFLYYDKTIVNESSVGDIELIIKDCVAADKKINFPIFGNGFYTASYFMATGCHSNWVMDSTNKFSSYDDNYNSDAGYKAARGIQYLKANNIFTNSDDPSKFGRPGKNGIGACVTGIWNYKYAYNAIGENLGCAPMPSFTLDGEKIHISSFSGYKLLGVKPQQDAKKVSVCKRIARYLSSEVCQLERFNEVNWGPTNISALANEKVRSHQGLAALRAQKPYSKPQVQCPSSWFGSVATLAASITAESSEAQIRNALQLYEDNLESLLSD